VAAQQLLSRGAKLAAGEGIGYVLGEDRPYALAVLPDGEAYDSVKYAALARKAAAEVLAPFGAVVEPAVPEPVSVGTIGPVQLELALGRFGMVTGLPVASTGGIGGNI
jgi:hypothetical protein